jgi:hypothetical protein
MIENTGSSMILRPIAEISVLYYGAIVIQTTFFMQMPAEER